MMLRVLAEMSRLLVLITALSSTQVAAEPSLRCIHGLLTEGHAHLLFCGYRIDGEAEGNYQELRTELEKFIRENVVVDRDKIEQDHEKETKQHLERMAPFNPKICEDSESIRRIFYNILSAKEIAKIRKQLEIPSDPNKGDCL